MIERCEECGETIMKHFHNPNCKECVLRNMRKSLKLYNEGIKK